MCGSVGVQQAARIAEGIDGQIVLAGDLAYMQGSMTDFIRCFDPYWGQFRRRWRPAPGNHEYDTAGAAGYFQYFGEAAGGGGGRSYYSFRAGDWLVLMLDSNIAHPRSDRRSIEFVRSELLSNRSQCTLAVWHHPLFSSGPNGPNVFMRDIWGLLYDNNADVVVAGHDHFYERFGKQDVDGRSDVRGIRQFIAGTGGAHALRLPADDRELAGAHQGARRAEADAQPSQLSVGVHRHDRRDRRFGSRRLSLRARRLKSLPEAPSQSLPHERTNTSV